MFPELSKLPTTEDSMLAFIFQMTAQSISALCAEIFSGYFLMKTFPWINLDARNLELFLFVEPVNQLFKTMTIYQKIEILKQWYIKCTNPPTYQVFLVSFELIDVNQNSAKAVRKNLTLKQTYQTL